MTELTEDAVQRAAEVMLRQYEREDDPAPFGITWRDFAGDAREILAAAVSAPGRGRPPVLRAGRSLGRTLYEVTGDDWKAHPCIGMVDTREWAERIVGAVNAAAGGAQDA